MTTPDPTTASGRAELRAMCNAPLWNRASDIIAAARTALPAALDHIDKLERELADAQGVAERVSDVEERLGRVENAVDNLNGWDRP